MDHRVFVWDCSEKALAARSIVNAHLHASSDSIEARAAAGRPVRCLHGHEAHARSARRNGYRY